MRNALEDVGEDGVTTGDVKVEEGEGVDEASDESASAQVLVSILSVERSCRRR